MLIYCSGIPAILSLPFASNKWLIFDLLKVITSLAFIFLKIDLTISDNSDSDYFYQWFALKI